MNRRLAAILLLIALPAAAAPQAAFDPNASPSVRQELTVEQCVAIGLVYSKSLYGSEMNVRAAEARHGEARAQRLPALKLQAGYTRLSPVPSATIEVDIPTLPPMVFTVSDTVRDSTRLQLTLQQPLFTGFALESQVRAARLSARATRERYRSDRSALAYDIQSAYWGLVRAREMKRLLDDSVQTIESHRQDVRRLFEQGLAKNNDLLKVQVQLANTRVSQLEAANGVRLAMMTLNSLLGLSLDTEIEPVSRPGAASAEPDAAAGDGVEQALRERPEMKAVNDEVAAAQAGLRAARGGRLPQLFLVGNYTYANPNDRIFPVEARFRDTWDVSLALQFNIWNGRQATFQVRQALARLEQARAGRAQLRDGVTLEVRKARFDLQQAAQKIGLADEAVAQAEENHRITRERFKAGLTPNSELLDAEVFLLQAQVSRTDARIGHELARARLAKALGSGPAEQVSLEEKR